MREGKREERSPFSWLCILVGRAIKTETYIVLSVIQASLQIVINAKAAYRRRVVGKRVAADLELF